MSAPLPSVSSWWNWFASRTDTPRSAESARPRLETLETRIALSTTALVKDINPLALDSFPADLTEVNGTVFFAADEGTNGRELWKSDGTSAGTQLVKNINPGGVGSDPRDLVNFNGTLFFAADDGTNGNELWKSDGTSAGTELVKDINPGDSSFLNDLTNVNGTLFFAADDVTGNEELWKSDGTAGGTELVKDINGGAGGTYPNDLTNVNGTLFFEATDGVTGYELWKSDGTEAGTELVKNIYPGAANSFPSNLTNVNGTLFFQAAEAVNGYELWKSDGTGAGTQLVKNINPAAANSRPAELANVNGTLFFRADDGTNGFELWKSDGTEAGTQLVKNINPLGASSLPEALINVNGVLYFGADDGTNGQELWQSDGTEAGTQLVENINPGGADSAPASFALLNGSLLFAADNGTNGRELFKLSTTVSDPDLVAASDTGSSNTDNITSDATPTFTGTADPDATVQIFDGTTLLGTATNTAGNWTFTVATPLADGVHNITARAEEDGIFAVSNPLQVTTDATPPTVTVNQAVGQVDPTTDTSIDFTAIFSEPVTGFDADDVVIGGTAGATTATVTPVSTTEYTITVTGMTQPGTVTVEIAAGAAVDDLGNASLASTSTDNSVQFNVDAPTPLVKRFAVGADAGGTPLVTVYDADGNLLFGFFAYDPGFTGGVRVATGDFDGDGTEDIITGAGPGGGPHVRVFSGVDGTPITGFFAYDPTFAGGVFVAVGDIDNDGFLDIITGAGAGGGPHVKAFSSAGKGTLASFFAYNPAFAGGVTVAVGDIDNDGFGDIITGAGAGGSPHVRVFSGGGRGILADFFAFDPGFQGGVFVASGDLNGNGFADLIVGAGAGGGPHVRAFDGGGAGTLADFFAFDAGFSGGTRVASLDRDADGNEELLVGVGPGAAPDVRTFETDPFGQVDSFFALDGVFAGGLYVG